MASTSVLVELVCGELGIDASQPLVARVKAAAQLVGIQFVSVRATTEALAAQLLPVTQKEDSDDDDVVLTHVTTPRSKAKASLAEAVRTGAIVQIDDSEPRRPPASALTFAISACISAISASTSPAGTMRPSESAA